MEEGTEASHTAAEDDSRRAYQDELEARRFGSGRREVGDGEHSGLAQIVESSNTEADRLAEEYRHNHSAGLSITIGELIEVGGQKIRGEIERRFVGGHVEIVEPQE